MINMIKHSEFGRRYAIKMLALPGYQMKKTNTGL